jgi:hypothetical protein
MTKTINKHFDPINIYRRFIVRGSMVLMMLLTFIIQLPAQTIISSTGDGGFETGYHICFEWLDSSERCKQQMVCWNFRKECWAPEVFILM